MGLVNMVYNKLDKWDNELTEKRRNRVEPVNIYQKHWSEHMVCSECFTENSIDNNYCIDCGHKLKKIENKYIDKKYCPICGEKVNIDMRYCSKYGHEIKLKNKIRRCAVCGEWIDEERYCINCGHDTLERSRLLLPINTDNCWVTCNHMKICNNCGQKYQRFYNYCEYCGEKLVNR